VPDGDTFVRGPPPAPASTTDAPPATLWDFTATGPPLPPITLVDTVIARHSAGQLPSPAPADWPTLALHATPAAPLGTRHPHQLGVHPRYDRRPPTLPATQPRPGRASQTIWSVAPSYIGRSRPKGARSTTYPLQSHADYLTKLPEFKDRFALVPNNRNPNWGARARVTGRALASWPTRRSTSTASSDCSWTLPEPDHPRPAPATAPATPSPQRACRLQDMNYPPPPPTPLGATARARLRRTPTRVLITNNVLYFAAPAVRPGQS
jgi:hypothetical protein